MATKLSTDRVEKMPNKDTLDGLYAKYKNVKGRVSSASGELGVAITNAVKEKNLHAQAFNKACSLKRMGDNDPVKLRAWLDHFDFYRDVLELDLKKAADLFKDDEGKKSGMGAKPDKAPAKKNGGKTDVRQATSGQPVPRSEFQAGLKANIAAGDKMASEVNKLADKAGADLPAAKPH